MSTLVLDVETVPLADSMAAPYPEADRSAPSNYKAEEAIAKWRAADRITWSEARAKECSLTPRLGRIVCLGWAQDDDEPQEMVAAEEDQEIALLYKAWSMIEPGTQLVTFNGSFDLRFLAIRSLVLGVLPSRAYNQVTDWFRRYSTRPHFDCRAVLTGWDDRQSGKLGEWCASFGIPHDDTTSGADVYRLAQAGNWDAIADHCLSDVGSTRELYRRIAPLFDFNMRAA